MCFVCSIMSLWCMSGGFHFWVFWMELFCMRRILRGAFGSTFIPYWDFFLPWKITPNTAVTDHSQGFWKDTLPSYMSHSYIPAFLPPCLTVIQQWYDFDHFDYLCWCPIHHLINKDTGCNMGWNCRCLSIQQVVKKYILQLEMTVI